MFLIDIHSYLPNKILFDLGFIVIHWYGFLITLGVIAGFLVARFLFKKYNISLDHLYNPMFYLIIFGLVGARAYHVLNELPYYIQNPTQIFAVWNGGLAFHGGLIGGFLVLFFYIKKNLYKICIKIDNNQETITKKKSIVNSQLSRRLVFLSCFLVIADILAPALAVGQAIGRWGNYFNQELYGLPTSLPLGIPITLANRMPGFENFEFFHPTFLYESLASLVIFLILIYLHKRRLKKVTSYQLPVTSYGSIFSIYLISYSIVRILTELIRIDQTPLILGVRLPIIASGLLIIAGIFILWYVKKVNK